jgi:hypothetical protein
MHGYHGTATAFSRCPYWALIYLIGLGSNVNLWLRQNHFRRHSFIPAVRLLDSIISISTAQMEPDARYISTYCVGLAEYDKGGSSIL